MRVSQSAPRRGSAIGKWPFANSTMSVSAIGLGCNSLGTILDATESESVVRTALDGGISFFDTADVYGNGRSEELLGKALAGHRHEVIIATKFGMPREGEPDSGGASRRLVNDAAEASLRRLGTDYIDLYQLHQPDPEVPVEETARALMDLVQQGKVRFLGVCNVSAEQLDTYEGVFGDRRDKILTSIQVQYSLLRRDAEHKLIPRCRALGFGLLPYFPLASGLLTGKYRFGERPPPGSRIARWGQTAERVLNSPEMQLVETLAAWAAQRQRSILELAIGWLLSCDVIPSVIAGATSPVQVRANCLAANWTLTEEERLEVHVLLEGGRSSGPR